MSSNAGACSIHLGNYIIEVAPGSVHSNAQKDRDASQSPSRPQTGTPKSKNKHTSSNVSANMGISVIPNVGANSSGTGPTVGLNAEKSNGRSALNFELQWLKFLRDAEEDYVTRLIRGEKQHQALSVFEVNFDVFETYLLRVSGRALAATQHLNLNLTSSLQSHMRIFDTQLEQEPYEDILRQEAEERLYVRKQGRMRRRLRNQRGTATFGGPPAVQEEPQPNIVYNESPSKTAQVPLQTHQSLFTLHPIAEEHSQLHLSSDQIEDSPNNTRQIGPLRLTSQLNSQLNVGSPKLQMLDSLNERDARSGEQEQEDEELIEEDNEEGDFDRAGAAAYHDIIVHKPPEEHHQETMMFGHSREFDETSTLQNISPIPTETVTRLPTSVQLPADQLPHEAQQDYHLQSLQQPHLEGDTKGLRSSSSKIQDDPHRQHREPQAGQSHHKFKLFDSKQAHNEDTMGAVEPEQLKEESSQPKIDIQESQPAQSSLTEEQLQMAIRELAQSQIEKSVEIHQELADLQQNLPAVATSNKFEALNKIKIGEHTIGDPYQSLGDTSLPNNLTANQEVVIDPNPNTQSQEVPQGHPNQTFELGEQYTINDVTELDNTNPFREKSVVSYQHQGTGETLAQPVTSHHAADSPQKEDPSFGGDHSSIPGGQSGHIEHQIESQPEQDHTLEQQPSNPEYGNTFEMKVNSIDLIGSQANEDSPTHEDLVVAPPIQHEREVVHLEAEVLRAATGVTSVHDQTQDSLQMASVPQIIKQESQRSHVPVNPLDRTSQHLHPSHISEDHHPVQVQDSSVEMMQKQISLPPKEFRSVGNTPLNLTLADESIPRVEIAVGTTQIEREASPLRADAATGTSHISGPPKNEVRDQSVNNMNQTHANIGTSALNISRADEGLSAITRNNDISKLGSFSPRLANKSLNESREMVSATVSVQNHSLINTQGYPSLPHIPQAAQAAPHQQQQHPEKLQITLTAEPDKPIMVEVRGGEKDFVISALTQHLFDILSRPKGLTLAPNLEQNSSCEDRASEDQEVINSPEQLGQLDSKGVFTINNQAVSTKVKQLKKQLKKEGTLPSVQRNQARKIGGVLFDSATRQEMYSGGLPGLSSGSNQMTIQENDQSSDKPLPQIRVSSNEGDQHQMIAQQTGGDSAFIKMNTNNWKSKGSSRSSASGIPLSPLTTSNIEEVKKEFGHTRLMSKEEPVITQQIVQTFNKEIVTKRTTELAYASEKIKEDAAQHTNFESDLVSAHAGTISAMGSIPNTLRIEEPVIPLAHQESSASKDSSHQRHHLLQPLTPHQTQESFRKISSEEALQILQKQQSLQRSVDTVNTPTSGKGSLRQIHRSRPETANFNKAYAASTEPEQVTVADQEKQIQQMMEDLEHARQRLSMMIRHENEGQGMFAADQTPMSPIAADNDAQENVLQDPETPKYKDEDISIADQQASLASRLETPGADAQDGVHIQEIINSAPAQLEQVNLAPLHPTIPQSHPNGYFSTEADYLMVRAESNTRLRQSGSSEANDQYLKQPKLNFFDNQNIKVNAAITQQTQPTNATDNFFNSQFGFSDQDQLMVDGDFILAEGYPMLNYMQDTRNGYMGQTQYYDFTQTSFTPVLASSNANGMLGGSQQMTPNAYRIRKVILPNYYPINGGNSSSMSYGAGGPADNTQITGTSPPSNATALYPPSHLQSRDASQTKQLPVVKTRKRYFQTTMQNPSCSNYGMNPLVVLQNGNGATQNAKKGAKDKLGSQQVNHRSLSPVRANQKRVYYTTSYMTKKQLLQQLQQEEWFRQQQQSLLSPNTTGQLSSDEFQQFAFYSQSPQPRMKASPYMSEDEFKILNNFYDIQCEPTGMQRGGLPLMKVKRIHRPKNRNYFNFTDENNNVSLPKALTSLQIFYPHFQPNQNESLSKTLSTPSKWFERFNQSTRNLNNTIQSMHKEHSLGGGAGMVPGGGPVSDSMRIRSGSQQPLFIKRQTPGAGPGLVENGEFDGMAQRQAKVNVINSRKFFSSTKEGNTSNFMPPLKKIYTQTMKDDLRDKYARTTGGTQKKGTKLPPKPSKNKAGNQNPTGMTSGANASSATNATSQGLLGASGKKNRSLSASQKQILLNKMSNQQQQQSDQQQQVIQIPPNSIIYANHNQQVCFGVNIITKSDK